MKTLLTVAMLTIALCAFGANPTFEAFLGANGITIVTNKSANKVIIDGSALSNSIAGNFVRSNNGVATNITNVASSYVLGVSHSNIFNARYYGATGNGSTDDTTAIQAAFNAPGPGISGTIIIPSGTYKITATLTNYAMKDVEVVGNGPGTAVGAFPSSATIFVWYGASNGTMFAIDRSDGMRYRNLHFQSFTTNTPTVMVSINQSGPSAWGTMTDCEFDRCTFVSIHTNLAAPFYAVQIATNATGNCENMRFVDCYWQGFGLDWYPATNNSFGLWIGNQPNAKNIIVRGGSAHNFTNFVYASNGGLTVEDMLLTGSSVDFHVVNSADPMVFRHNRTEVNRQFMVVDGGGPIVLRENTCNDATVMVTNYGIVEVNATSYFEADNNVFITSATITNFVVNSSFSPSLVAFNNKWTTNDDTYNGLVGFKGGVSRFLNAGDNKISFYSPPTIAWTKFGLNTTNPLTEFDMNGMATFRNGITNRAGFTNSGLVVIGTNANGWLIISNTASVTNTALQNGNANAPSIYFGPGGNTGINTNNPAVPLHVQGAASFGNNQAATISATGQGSFTSFVSVDTVGNRVGLNYDGAPQVNLPGTGRLGWDSSSIGGSPDTDIRRAGPGAVVSTNAGVWSSIVAGAGNGNTNYTLLASQGKVYMGSSNVNISAVMAGVAGIALKSSVTITNLSANTWGIQFSSVTNRWWFRGLAMQTNSPTVITNNTALVLNLEIDGTNILCDWKHYAPFP